MGRAGISRVEIERFPNQVSVTIWTARPGIVIGRRGAAVKEMRRKLEEMTGKRVSVDVQEVAQPELDARLVAENVVSQLERRISHTRAMKRVVQSAMRSGAEGIKVMCKGRLHGAEMARQAWQREGRVPLQTLRADIDYAQEEAHTTYGRIGVKVWIYKGEILPELKEQEEPFVV
jgi:small subunit ribosomal protein S3